MENKEHRLAAVLYADINSFSRMMEQDEEGTLLLLEQLNHLVRKLVSDHRGNIIKTIGDAYLVDFKTALDAVKCGIQIQHDLAALNTGSQQKKLLLRIGIHLGDIYFFENDALGEGINIAARLQGITKPGRICISSEVYNQVFQKIDLPIRNIGRVDLKNISRDIRVYEIITDSSMDAYPQGERLEEPDSKSREEQTGKPTEEPPLEFEDLKRIVKDTIRYAGKKIEEEFLAKAPPFREEPSSFRGAWDRSFQYPIEAKEEHSILSRKEIRQLRKEKRRGLGTRHYYETYKKMVERDAEKGKSGFRAHLIPFAAVAGFLLVLNLLTTPFPWFLFPVGGWGIGLYIHGATVKEKNRRKRDLDKLPVLSEEQTYLIKQIHRIREQFKGHLSATVAVSGFLAMVNLVTSPSFPWFLFPSVALGLGLLIHGSSFMGKRKELNRRLKESLSLEPASAAPVLSPQDSTVVLEAKRLEQALLQKVREMNNPELLSEMETVLPDYVEQIRNLSFKEKEIQDLLQTIPLSELEGDKKKLVEKIEGTMDPLVQREYRTSLAELDKQLSSFRQLHDRGEIVTLKIQSSLNSLRKMQADLTRITEGPGKPSYSIDPLRKRADELSNYLSDLEKGYRELE